MSTFAEISELFDSNPNDMLLASIYYALNDWRWHPRKSPQTIQNYLSEIEERISMREFCRRDVLLWMAKKSNLSLGWEQESFASLLEIGDWSNR
jgi:hypothetical protein